MRNILTIVSEYGYWGEELLGPLETFDAAGYTTTIATPKGARPHALPPSMDPDYFDPPLGKAVTTADVAERVKKLDASTRLDDPKSLAGWVPERPYWSGQNALREIEAYYRDVEKLAKDLEAYDALCLVGGSGPIIDMCNNDRVHALVLGFYRQNKPIAAICYGVTCLAFARDLQDRKSLIWGKHVTGHAKEYDYKDGTGFLGVDLNMGPPPYPLEYILRDATGPDGAYHGNFGHDTSVIVDYPFITGRSNQDSFPTAQKLVEALDKGLTRWGW